MQFLRWNERVHRVDDRLAFPTRQRFRNLGHYWEHHSANFFILTPLWLRYTLWPLEPAAVLTERLSMTISTLNSLRSFLAIALLALTNAVTADAADKLVHAFRGSDGALPLALVADSKGNLFGVASTAGTGSNSTCTSLGSACGTVFELSPNADGEWKTTVLYNFTGGSDGNSPSDLVIDSAGNLFGVASQGGNGAGCAYRNGCGTVFELSPGAPHYSFTVLHAFTGGRDGALPSYIVRDSAGDLYVTNASGGNKQTLCGNGCGTIFRLVPYGTGYKGSTLRVFNWGFNNPEAAAPNGRLTLDPAGNLYGVAGGGVFNDNWNTSFGTVYELIPTASGQWKEVVIYDFCPNSVNCLDGTSPAAGLTFDSQGNLFGSTTAGGQFGNGVIFELSPSSGAWSYNVIYNFTGGADGGLPVSPLTLGNDGEFFGTNASGGNSNCLCGVAFKLQSVSGAWNLGVLHSFSGGSDGANPNTANGLVLDSLGILYGTTVFGGIETPPCNGLCGEVYELTESASATGATP